MFGRPPLAEFGADAARSFADHTTGVMPRRCRWRAGSRRSSAGYTETGIVGKIHLDIATEQLSLKNMLVHGTNKRLRPTKNKKKLENLTRLKRTSPG